MDQGTSSDAVEARDESPAAPTRRQTGADVALALGCVAAAVLMQLTQWDAVPANRAPDALSVLLSVSAVAPLAWRRRRPLAVLAACLPGLLGLVAARYSAGVAPLGVLVAYYTVAAWGSRRAARRGTALVVVGAAVVLALRPVDLSPEGMVVNSAVLICGWVLGTGTRERRALHAALVTESAREIELARERGDRAAAEERLRISRELHDVLGHAMSTMVVQAGVAEHLLQTRPDEALAALNRISRTGRSSLQELRHLLRATRGPGDDAPLPPQPGLRDLPELVARVEAAGLPVRFTDALDPRTALSPGLELAVYRVVQEALTNSLRHAGPARAQVRLAGTPTDLEVEVLDDGRGPRGADGPGDGHGDGHGLTGMRERVMIHAGELVTGAAPSGGFRVRARFPVDGRTQPGPAPEAVAGTA